MLVKREMGRVGLVEVYRKGDFYELIVAGVIKERSRDLEFVLKAYDRYCRS